MTACPANTTSAAGSDAVTDCVCTSSAAGSTVAGDCSCLAGYTAETDGVACRACGAGTYKAATGAGVCSACPANAESAVGSAACYCSAGFKRTDGGSCEYPAYTGVIAGAGAGVAVLAILVGAWMWWRCRRSSREESHKLEEGEHWLELSNGENFLCS